MVCERCKNDLADDQKDDLMKKFGESEEGNFKVIDTVGVPHPYCIGPKHVGWASDKYGGILGEAAILDAEEHGIHCCICKGKLSYAEHEQALLVECKVDIQGNEELRKYLLKIKDLTVKEKFAGFAFIKAKDFKGLENDETIWYEAEE